jgi:hypothetical protein
MMSFEGDKLWEGRKGIELMNGRLQKRSASEMRGRGRMPRAKSYLPSNMLFPPFPQFVDPSFSPPPHIENDNFFGQCEKD